MPCRSSNTRGGNRSGTTSGRCCIPRALGVTFPQVSEWAVFSEGTSSLSSVDFNLEKNEAFLESTCARFPSTGVHQGGEDVSSLPPCCTRRMGGRRQALTTERRSVQHLREGEWINGKMFPSMAIVACHVDSDRLAVSDLAFCDKAV